MKKQPGGNMIARIPLKLLTTILCVLLSYNSFAQDWPSYGGDNGSRKYSALDQINSSNVVRLETAWEWDSVDNATVANNIEQENFRAMQQDLRQPQ